MSSKFFGNKNNKIDKNSKSKPPKQNQKGSKSSGVMKKSGRGK
tara:strand:+ start:163 stop:291 length:129 start_codon:yes stop_codon:yes gene_type:complete